MEWVIGCLHGMGNSFPGRLPYFELVIKFNMYA